MAKKTKRIQQMTVAQFEAAFPDEDACRAYLVASRWPDGVRCPRCGSDRAYKIAMPWKWECPDCGAGNAYRFSHLTGTIFENTNKPLRDWFRVLHLMLTSKKGMSALQIYRMLGFGSYKTAWFMCHRLRVAMVDMDFQKLGGIVEVDETWIGGKAKNRHKSKRGGGKGGGGGGLASGKTPVVGAVSRKGGIVARVLETVTQGAIHAFVSQAVSHKVSLLVSDDSRAYLTLKSEFPHEIINHAKGEYVVGAIHTNTIEGFWSILKRGIVGSFHKVSRKYLALYVAEFAFRYNNRQNADIFRTAIKEC
jgi:transposase-like protein